MDSRLLECVSSLQKQTFRDFGVTIVDNSGKRISRLGGLGPGLGAAEFLAPHGLAVDSRGDLYVGEVSWTNWPQTYKDKPRPDDLRSLHKFRKVG